MKKARMSVTASRRLAVVSILAAGFLVAGNAPAWADRDERQGRQESSKDGRYNKKSERRGDHRQQQVTVVRELPRGYRTVVVNRSPYYVHEHRYYTRGPGGYIMVAPPVGALVATLPVGSLRVTIGGNFYFQTGDVYYRPARGGYTVIAAPFPAAPVHSSAVMVWTSTLNVRSGPGENFPVIGQAWQGETLFVNGQSPGWYYVQSASGAFGWIMSSYTHPLAAG
jgi:hypothetical protein